MNLKRSDNRGAAPPPPVPANDTMRRIQIGIAGVLTVLLLVGMAGLIGDRARENAAGNAAAAGTAKLPGDPQAPGSAPLEELGVQPVSGDAKGGSQPVETKAPPPAPSTVPDLEPDPTLQRARQSAR
ncbi:MAG: hypothetical protein C0520_08630 [Sphingopyxis sp.]|nr:hypothetical protein [Sphingopyxis sp.]